VPDNADILAAFLYWETIWTDSAQVHGAKFRGSSIPFAKVASQPLVGNTAACWSGGGGNGAKYTATTFRADVLRFLPRRKDANGAG